jgi:hypothetical protein
MARASWSAWFEQEQYLLLRPPRRWWRVTVTAFFFVWEPLTATGFVSHWWFSPNDIWLAVREGHYIGWAPVVMATGALHLSECFPYYVPRPTSWLVIGPYTMLLGSVAFFAFDALARRLGASARRRILLAAVEVVLTWPMFTLWGHPEDVLAVGSSAYALLDAFNGKRARAGWLLGAAIAVQPLVLVVVPLILVGAGARQAVRLVGRTLTPTIVLLVLPFAYDFRLTYRYVI